MTANGARLSQQFDANGWMTQMSQYDAANNLVSQTSYTRDRVGNITSQSDAGGTSSYTLDALYRLTQADLPGAANDELFSYDKVGNRKTYTKGSLSQGGSTRFYNYTANTNRLADIRIGSATGTVESSFAHDFEGRLTSQSGIGAKTLTWDAKGRVKTVGAESYSYDPMDYRIGRSGGALGNRSYFLEGEHLESEYSGEQLQAKYFRGSGVDELVAAWMYDTDSKLKPFLFHHDQVTSTTAVSGHNGGTTQSVKYAAFGAVQSSTGSSPNRLKYTGREEDGTGLMYYRARYYDPAIGRFISEDTKGFASGDMSFYVYALNNPINANDPMGFEAFVYAAPRVTKGYDFRAFDDNGAKIISGTFNVNTWSNSFNLPTGSYNVTPRPYIELNALQRAKDIITLDDRNAKVGIPTVSNTSNWNTTKFPDGSLRYGIQIHPGRTSSGGGVSQGCLVCSDVDFGRLNTLFNANYNDGGVRLQVLPGSIQDAFPSLKIPSGTPNFRGPIQPQPSFQFDNSLSIGGGGAAGGYLLYPNKSNNNGMISVYSK